MKKSIGDQLREARAAKGLSQSQLATKAIICKDTISSLETGRKKSTSIAVLQRLQNALDFNFDI